MKRRERHEYGLNAFVLIEEATHLLRTAPAATLATYYAGAVPFAVGFIYFWTDMSMNPFARQHVADSALGIAALFVWMKFWHAAFTARLRAQHTSRPLPPWTFRQIRNVLLPQVVIHSTGLFVLPLALALAFPFSWVYAFYSNVTVLADRDSSECLPIIRKAAKQALISPWTNFLGLSVLLLFGLFVFINWTAALLSMPGLMKTFLGIETAFSRSGVALANSTFLAIAVFATYLCVDPILKAFYVLRCFYGQALTSGEDLKTDLRHFPSVSPVAVMTVTILLLLAPAARAQAPANTPDANSQIDQAEFDRQIESVIHQPQYAWRMRAQEPTAAERGMITRFIESAARTIRNAANDIFRWIIDWMNKEDSRGPANPPAFGFGPRSLPYLLILLLAAGLVAVLLFWLRGRDRKTTTIAAEALRQAVPDITDENISADQLPGDAWTGLAIELMERGDYRLAMRAFYLASLAHLARRNLIGVARFKSNRDYESELQRRAHEIPNVIALFGENLHAFERVWYGLHEVNREIVQSFAANVDRIRSAA